MTTNAYAYARDNNEQIHMTINAPKVQIPRVEILRVCTPFNSRNIDLYLNLFQKLN